MSAIVHITMIGGNCPVQVEGTIRSRRRGAQKWAFYFRARGNRWSFQVGDDPISAPDWEYEEEYKPDEPYAAGWMTEQEARAFLMQAANQWAEEHP